MAFEEEKKHNKRLGCKFNGKVINGKKEGYGTYRFANGEIFRGTFMNDLKTHHGVLLRKSGEAYIGGFKNDQFYGEGTLRSKMGHIIRGIWNGTSDDPYKMAPDADMAILYKNKELFEGKGRNGRREGKG